MTAEAALEAVLREVEPAARLVTERQLRKILSFLRDAGRPVPPNPDLPFWITREDLSDADILDRAVLADERPRFLLLSSPDDRLIDDLPRELQLREYWRLLFQAAVLRAIDDKLASAALSVVTCSHRLSHYGAWVAREIRFVLETDHVTDPEADDAARYRAFAATYLDLRYFHPAAVEEFFPSLSHHRDGVESMLNADVDGAALLARTRPHGAADPDPEITPDEHWADTTAGDTTADGSPTPQPTGQFAALLARANDADARGNLVRAAILRTRAESAATGDDREGAVTAARTALGRMVEQLADVLGWDNHTQQEWRQALAPLLAPASTGIWPRPARCLYELQKIPNSLSQPLFTVDLAEYIRTFGRRPVKRPLPHARVVLQLMHLKRAHAQMLKSGLPEQARFRLDRLFHHECHRAEHNIRHEFTPILRAAIEDSGLKPTNRVEEIARDKMVAELLDRICDRGYLRIGNLRDAIARNQLKIADLKGPGEFFRGDPLLKVDVRLAYDLDGVYRRGEFYLRWLQRFSGLFFGTKFGRLLTLYLLLPFGGSFLTMNALEHLVHKAKDIYASASKILAPKKPVATPPPETATAAGQPDGKITENEVAFNEDTGEIEFDDEAAAAAVRKVVTHTEHPPSFLVEWPTIVGFGVFLLLMFHAPPFRRAVFTGFRYLWRAIRFVLWDAPKAVLNSAFVKSIRRSATARFANRYLTWAVLFTCVVVGVMWFLGATPKALAKWGAITFGAVALVSNTRAGWVVQERFAESLSDRWRMIRVDLLPGLIGGIISFFRWLANWVEGKLYAVDEWLRFRGGDSQGSIALKAVLGLLWFPIAYVTRFSFYLLIEPQVNPVKHFPVVTVSHKMLLPLTIPLAPGAPSAFGQVLVNQLGLGVAEANAWALGIITCIPGIFGFIAWELKENWRLYGANRPEKLKPVTLGSHGESMRGLLRPGFHSGTVPKLYRKMRRAERKAVTGHAAGKKQRTAIAWHHHDLEHAAEGVRRFAERELLPLLEGSPEWGNLRVEVAGVHFGCLRAVIEFRSRELGRDVFVLAFENRHGRIEASVEKAGWYDKLTEGQRGVFTAALRGMLDMAAAELLDGRERGEPADLNGRFAALGERCDWDGWVVKWRVPK